MGPRNGGEQKSLSSHPQNDRDNSRNGILVEDEHDFVVKPCPSPFNLCVGKFNQFRLETDDATGWLYNAIAGSTAIMSNIFLSTAFITLAERELGCEDDNVECGKVHGFKPSSLISMIGAASGVISAFFLPYMGAVVDHSRHRRSLGMYASLAFIVIQAIQIGTMQWNWFFMVILQVVNGFIYQVIDLSVFAYLPEIGAQVKKRETFTWYNSLFSITGFAHQAGFLIIVVGIGLACHLDDHRIGQVGQFVDVIVSGGYFYISWYYLTERKARRPLKEGESLAVVGFKQTFKTGKGLISQYPRSIGLYFLGLAFSSAAVDSLSSVSVTFFNEVLKFDAAQIGLIFLITLVFTLPGAYFAFWLATKTNPLVAMKIFLATVFCVNFVSFSLLTDPSKAIEAYFCSIAWGFCLGMYYPLMKIIFSTIVPRGQEAELAGFFKYSSQIIVWLPPLIFTVMNEKGVNLSLAGMSINIFVFVALILYSGMLPWDQCLEDAKVNRMSSIELRCDNFVVNEEGELL